MAVKLSRVALGYYFFGVGLFILLAPWTPLWSRNFFILRSGFLSGFLLSPWLRGAVSGIGVLLLATGVFDALRFSAGRGES